MPLIEISDETFELLCQLKRKVNVSTASKLVEHLAEKGARNIGLSVGTDSLDTNVASDDISIDRGAKSFNVSRDGNMRIEKRIDDVDIEEIVLDVPQLDHILPTLLTEFRSKDLVNVEMVTAFVEGKPFYHKRWNQTLFHVIEILLGEGVSIDEIVEKLNGFATVGKNLDDFLSYNEDLDISHKIQNPRIVWPLIENLSKYWEIDVEIKFKWENNAKLELRGMYAELKTNRRVEDRSS